MHEDGDDSRPGGARARGRAVTPDQAVISYLMLRKLVGLLGVGLPVVLPVGCLLQGSCDGLLPSISAYYGSNMGDVFVGILVAVGTFLFTYQGYERADLWAGRIACVCALGVALFPWQHAVAWVPVVHYVSAAGMFLTLSFFSLCLFTKGRGEPTPEKLKRNRIYRTCGWTMLGAIALIGLYSWLGPGEVPEGEASGLASLGPVFWLEAIALWAFGISWAVKGEVLFCDHGDGMCG